LLKVDDADDGGGYDDDHRNKVL